MWWSEDTVKTNPSHVCVAQRALRRLITRGKNFYWLCRQITLPESPRKKGISQKIQTTPRGNMTPSWKVVFTIHLCLFSGEKEGAEFPGKLGKPLLVTTDWDTRRGIPAMPLKVVWNHTLRNLKYNSSFIHEACRSARLLWRVTQCTVFHSHSLLFRL